ncbi:MAG: hypothetical protein ACQCN5_07330 [Candidatus Bathyarchaeia archaeon]
MTNAILADDGKKYFPPDPKGFQSIAESLEQAKKEFEASLECKTERLVFASKENESLFDAQYRDYVKSLGDEAEPETDESDSIDSFCRFGNWTLVGKGGITNSHCGQFLYLSACKNAISNPHAHDKTDLFGQSFHGKQDVHKVFNHCHKSTCPVCYRQGWAFRLASEATENIKDAAKIYGVPEHIIISVPSRDYGLSFESLKSKVRKVAASRGVIGGAMIFHPFRYRKFDIVKGGIRHMKGWYFAPHFHLVGFFAQSYNAKCRSCPKMKQFEYQTLSGRVVKRIGEQTVCAGCDGFESRFRLLAFGEFLGKNREGKYTYSGSWLDDKGRSHKADGYIVKVAEARKTIHGTFWYQLNHAGHLIGKSHFSPLTWFGVCGCKKMKLFKPVGKVRSCRICGGEMVPVRYTGKALYEEFDWYMSNDFIVDSQEVVDGELVNVFEIDEVMLAKLEAKKRR